MMNYRKTHPHSYLKSLILPPSLSSLGHVHATSRTIKLYGSILHNNVPMSDLAAVWERSSTNFLKFEAL